MAAKTRTTLIAMPNADWRWEAALLHIWEVLLDELQWASLHPKVFQCDGVSFTDREKFVQFYLDKLNVHDMNTGCFMLTLNLRDMWGTIHRTRRWAFTSKTEVLEER